MDLDTLYAFGDELSKLAGAPSMLRQRRELVRRMKTASFTTQSAPHFERMADQVSKAIEAKEDARANRNPKPFYTKLTQDEEPGPYFPLNPPPNEPEVIYG